MYTAKQEILSPPYPHNFAPTYSGKQLSEILKSEGQDAQLVLKLAYCKLRFQVDVMQFLFSRPDRICWTAKTYCSGSKLSGSG